MYASLYRCSPSDVEKVRIFRPWDVKSVENCAKNCAKNREDDFQDATVSTTTEHENLSANEQENEKFNTEQLIKPREEKPEKSLQLEPNREISLTGKFTERVPPIPEYSQFLDGCPSLYPDFNHLNIAHSLGLTPSDPLVLECLNQGCSLEEYARVINQEHQSRVINARKQRPKKYRCPHCNVGFSNNGQLKGHIRIHTGERPFRCDEKNCGKTFTRNEELTRHKRIHSGLRPFPCPHCGKRFGRKDHLKKHSRTHFQPRGLYAVPVVLPFETWASAGAVPPFVSMFGY